MLVQTHAIHANKSCLEIFGVAMVKNRCSQPGDVILKLTVSQKLTDGIKLVFCMLVQIQEN